MAMNYVDNSTEEYEFNFGDRNYALEFLIDLIKASKMSIREVNLADITDQYLERINNMETIDLDKANSFIGLAITLLNIKTKSLMPRYGALEDDNYIPEEEDLKMQMEWYNLFSGKAIELKCLEVRDRFYRMPMFTEKDARMVCNDATMDILLDALGKIIRKTEFNDVIEETKNINREEFTLSDKYKNLGDLIKQVKALRFSELFIADTSIDSLITTFLALLHLIKVQFVRVEQVEQFLDIDIIMNDGAENMSLEDIVDEEA